MNCAEEGEPWHGGDYILTYTSDMRGIVLLFLWLLCCIFTFFLREVNAGERSKLDGPGGLNPSLFVPRIGTT